MLEQGLAEAEDGEQQQDDGAPSLRLEDRLISWRNYVDVDVQGQNDPPDEPYRQVDNLDRVVTGPDR